MSGKKRMQSVREAKDRRAKKLAIGGGVLLAVLLAWELPHYLGGHKSATPPAATTPASTTPGTATPATTPTPGVTPVTATATPAASTKLPNSDATPSYAKGQLAGFSTFAAKDPFAQQLVAQTSPSGSGSGSGSSAGSSSGSAASSGSGVATSGRTLAHSGAVTIAINGKRESVRVGASFPSANPVFRLVSLANGTARIGIANGSYSSGAQTVLLRLHRTLTLVDTANNVHYKLQLLG
jgi:hypothetical protein